MATPYENAGGLLGPLGTDPEELKKLMAQIAAVSQQFGPSEADRSAANNQALINFGLAMMGTRKGQEWPTLGNAGFVALDARDRSLAGAQAGKKAQMAEALQAMSLLGQVQKQKQAAAMQQAIPGIFAGTAGGMAPGALPEGAAGPPAIATGQDKVAAYRRLSDFYAQQPGGAAQSKIFAEIADKMEEEFSQTPHIMQDANGNLVSVQLGKRGGAKKVEGGFSPVEPIHFGGTGGTTNIPIGSLTGKQLGPGMPATPSADALLTDARAREFNRLKAQEIQGGDQPMSPEAIANAAARYNIDGTLPPMGMGKVAGTYRSAILNEAARQAQASGLTPDEQRYRHMENKGGAQALGQLQRSEAMVGAFEKNFVRNADMALELSKKVDNTGVPLANRWVNAGKRAITGDPALTAYDAAIKTASNEYAKILSGSMGNQQMAESEIKKVEALLNAAQTQEQVDAVIKLMKRETQNRMTGFKEQKRELISNMRGGNAPSAPAAADPLGLR